MRRVGAPALDTLRVRVQAALGAYDEAEIQRLEALGLSPETDPTVLVDTDPTVLVDGPGPRMCFQLAGTPKRTKNRVHLDIDARDRSSEVKRLTALRASMLSEFADWITLLDPEGNEFCIVGPTNDA